MTRKKPFSVFAFLPLLLFIISSCQHRFGGFQASSRETFGHERGRPLRISKEQLPPVTEAIPGPLQEEENRKIADLPVIEIPVTAPENPVNATKKIQAYAQKHVIKKAPEKEKPKKKKDKKKRVRFNDGLKIGTIFLLVAIIMGIFSLTQLTLLFGLVSILFLYFGLKKYYRQRRRRNIFKNK